MANHGELVGKFSNGKTAVANNEQIISGIERGVSNAVYSSVSNIIRQYPEVFNSDKQINVEIDGREVFRAVQKRANEHFRVSGRAAFDF